MFLLAETLQPLPSRILIGWAIVALCGISIGVYLRRFRWKFLHPPALALLFGGAFVLLGLLGGELLGRIGTAFPSTAVSITPVWPWEWTLLLAVCLSLSIAYLYPPRVAHLSVRTGRFLIGLRYFTAALIILASLRPTFQWTRQDKEPSELLILSDISRSMSTSDMSGGLSRYASQTKLLSDVSPIVERLRKEGTVKFFEYGSELKPIETLSSQPTDSTTAIGDALKDLTRTVQGKKIAGILLLGDGSQRGLPPRVEDPRLAARLIAELQIPIHTVTFGAAQLVGTTADLMLENLQTSPTVFVKNRAVIESTLRALGAAGREISVQLLVEKPTPENPQQRSLQPEGDPLIVKPKSADEAIPVQLSFVPEVPGELKVGLRVKPLDGEVLLSNNEQASYLTVMKGGINIAYFDSPRFEQQFLRRIDQSPDIQVEFIPVRKGTRAQNAPLKPDYFRPGAYDIFIIGDVPADYFGAGRARGDNLLLIRNLVENGTGLLMLGGERSFSAGDYGRTPLADLLPVVLAPNAQQAGADLDRDIKLVPTQAGLAHYIMRLDAPENNQAAWDALPPLKGASRFNELQPLGQVLANDQEGAPLLVAHTRGRGRILAFAGDTTWRWVTAGHEAEHQQFWRQAILWLAHKENQGDENVWVQLDSRRLRQGQPLDFTCGAKDKEGEPLKEAQLQVEVTNPEGKTFAVSPQPATRDSVGKFTETLVPGEYRIRVTGTLQGKLLGIGSQARFLVYDEDLELSNPIADAPLMQDLAEITGGQHLRPEQLPSFLDKLAETGLSPEVEQTSAISLWDNPIVVIVMALMLCLEWFYRKTTGLV